MEEKAQLLKLLKASEEDSKWVSEKYDELREKYEGKVFAVRGKKVIDSAESVEQLMDELERKNENIALLLIESIPPKNASFIL